MTARHPSSRAWPRAVALLTVLALVLGPDYDGPLKGLSKWFFPRAAHAATGKVGPFTPVAPGYRFKTRIHNLPFNCVGYITADALVTVCTPAGTTSKA